MKSVIAHRCSGGRASANDGMGVPLSPVLIVLKISSRDDPPRKVQLCARFAARIGWPKSSTSVGAEGPSPRPSVAVALDAADLLVELLPELDGLVRGGRRARKLHGLGDILGAREVGGEGLNEVGEIRHFLVGQVGPGGHRGVGHAAPDDVDEVLMGRERSAGSRTNLELARREVAGPGEQVRGGVAFAVPLLAVALRTVLEVERLARLPLRLSTDVGTLRAHRSHRPGTQRGEQHGDTPARIRGERSLVRGLPGARPLAREIVDEEDGIPDLVFLQELLPGWHGRVPRAAFFR